MADSQGKAARIRVRVSPNAASNEVGGFEDGVLRVKVAAPPIKGRANAELAAFLAHLLGVSKGEVVIVKGFTAREKLLEIHGVNQEEVLERLGGK